MEAPDKSVRIADGPSRKESGDMSNKDGRDVSPAVAVVRSILAERKDTMSRLTHELKPAAIRPGYRETWCGLEDQWDGAGTSPFTLAEGTERRVTCPDCIKAKAE